MATTRAALPAGARPTAVVATAGLLALALLAASCTGQPADRGSTPEAGRSTTAGVTSSSSSSSGASTSSASPSRARSASPSASGAPSQRVEVAAVDDVVTDLSTPWGLARLSDSSHLVSLRDEARIVRIGADGARTSVPATGEDGRVASVVPSGEGGLLGIAVEPGDDSTVYAYLTSEEDNRVVRMRYADGRLGPLQPLITGIPKAGIHNGGRLAFGPDGMLYVTTGDAGQTSHAQDRSSLGGKILRITPDGRPAPGNPFDGSPVWSLGHRNVQGIGWDDAGRMYASEFGQNTYDELNRIEPGRNYGWPEVEGMGDEQDEQRGFTRPLVTWPTAEASPSGLAVGDGAVWLAALRGERLWRVPLRGNGEVGDPASLLAGRLGRLRAVEVEPNGSLLVLTNNVSRGQPRPGDDRMVRVTLTP